MNEQTHKLYLVFATTNVEEQHAGYGFNYHPPARRFVGVFQVKGTDVEDLVKDRIKGYLVEHHYSLFNYEIKPFVMADVIDLS